MVKHISIKELGNIMGDILTGRTVNYGKNVYRLHRLNNGVAWISWLPFEKYRANMNTVDKYEKDFPVGWYALLRIA